MKLDMMELLNVTFRAISSLVALFLVTKMLGKKQVSQLSLFDYVIGISIGNFAAEMTINLESNEIYGIWAVILFGLVAYVIGILTMKSMRIRRFFMSKPTILIDKGEIIYKNLKQVNMDINDMLEQVRSAGYFDLYEVESAVMEANGNLSILPKSEYKPVTLQDMNIKKENSGLCANIVIDGKIMKKNLINMNKDEKWLKKVLRVEGHSDLSKLLLTSLSDGDDDTTKGKFQNTSLSDSSDIGSNIETTETYIKIDNVTINVDKNFNTWSVPQYGTTLNSGLVLMSSDYYVIVRDQQYLNNNDAKDSFINNYCVKLNVDKGFTTPSQETVKGDLTLGQGNQVGDNFLENGKVYVYTPYNNPAPADGYKYSGWWKEVK